MSPIRVLFFDLGDTLVHIRPQLYERAAIEIAQVIGYTGVDAGKRKQVAAKLQRAISNEWQARDGDDFQDVTNKEKENEYWLGFYRAVLRRMGLDRAPEKLVGFLACMQADPASFDCFEDVDETLSGLQNLGIKLGLISNAFPSANGILKRLNLSRWFEYIVLSYRCETAKPAAGIYQEALKQAGLRPEEAALVDDRISFVRGAEMVQMPALLIDRKYWANGYIKPKIHNLNEVVDFVQRRQQEAAHRNLGLAQPAVGSM